MSDIIEIVLGEMFYVIGVAEHCKDCGEEQIQCIETTPKVIAAVLNAGPSVSSYVAVCSECGNGSDFRENSPRKALERWDTLNLITSSEDKESTLGILDSLDAELSKDPIPEYVKLGQRPYCMKCRTWLLETDSDRWQCQTCDGTVSFDSEMAGFEEIPVDKIDDSDEWENPGPSNNILGDWDLLD